MPTTYWARTDSNTANNPALNLTGDASIEITFVPLGDTGDILLETNGGSFDPDTQVVIDGVAYNFTFELAASLPTRKNDGGQQVPTQFRGEETYVITVQDYPTAGETLRLAFLPDLQATSVEMDAFGNGAISLQNITTTGPGVICFATGTLIATPDGSRPVEALVAGDTVMTEDRGAQPLAWVSRSERAWPGSDAADLPVLIRAGALGGGLPLRDLIVSPQHKIVLRDAEAREVLAPVKSLTALPGVRRMKGKRQVTYHHLMLETHGILRAEGAACESFYPGATAMRMLAPVQRREIAVLFPRLAEGVTDGYGPPARPVLSVREAERWAAVLRAEVPAA